MKKDNLFKSNGSTLNPIPPDEVCEGARGCDDILVIGWRGEDLYIAASRSGIGDALLKLELAKHFLMEQLH